MQRERERLINTDTAAMYGPLHPPSRSNRIEKRMYIHWQVSNSQNVSSVPRMGIVASLRWSASGCRVYARKGVSSKIVDLVSYRGCFIGPYGRTVPRALWCRKWGGYFSRARSP